MKHLPLMLLVLVLAAAPLQAAVIVNEVMVNEPGTAQSLEWIELYNTGTDAHLSFYELKITSGTTVHTYSPQGTINSGQFMILSADTAAFRAAWGDGPFTAGSVIQVAISLSNQAGSVSLQTIGGGAPSILTWSSAGDDAITWERVDLGSDSVAASLDPRGATPNETNSHAPVTIDLAIDEVEAYSQNGATIIAFEIINRSVTELTDGILELYYYDESDPFNPADWIAAESVGPIDSAYTIILVGSYQIPGVYQHLVARVATPGDLRAYNDVADFVAPGTDFPPVRLSEFLANPTDGLTSEWVEIKNVSNETVDLHGWRLGDSIGYELIADASLSVDPGEYFVLAEDSSAFLAYYPDFEARLLQPESWRALNNTSDSLRLNDNHDLPVDRFYYTGLYASNYTWGRGETEERLNQWGRSTETGGTPGAFNEVIFAGDEGDAVRITIEPRIFSPDGNGFQDTTIITVLPSRANSYSLKIYDSEGRLVRTFEDGASGLAEHYVWDGRKDGGERLPIGIYILYFEAEGVESVKKTLVIAR